LGRMISGNTFLPPDSENADASALSAENRAWNSFYHSGKVEDYIRYAQLRRREETGREGAAGVPNAGKDPGVDH
ncbi:MAG: hypothetical protein J6S41_01955, partial [Clostridia bacterium]|nr:hypothetical protein [Clostridia bacterium]